MGSRGGRRKEGAVLNFIFFRGRERGVDRVRALIARQSFVPYSTVPLYLTNLYTLYSVEAIRQTLNYTKVETGLQSSSPPTPLSKYSYSIHLSMKKTWCRQRQPWRGSTSPPPPPGSPPELNTTNSQKLFIKGIASRDWYFQWPIVEGGAFFSSYVLYCGASKTLNLCIVCG
jgi:hypothetical protein